MARMTTDQALQAALEQMARSKDKDQVQFAEDALAVYRKEIQPEKGFSIDKWYEIILHIRTSCSLKFV